MVTVSIRMRWARYVARMGGEKHTGFLRENLKERDQLKDLGVHGRIILKCTSFFKKKN